MSSAAVMRHQQHIRFNAPASRASSATFVGGPISEVSSIDRRRRRRAGRRKVVGLQPCLARRRIGVRWRIEKRPPSQEPFVRTGPARRQVRHHDSTRHRQVRQHRMPRRRNDRCRHARHHSGIDAADPPPAEVWQHDALAGIRSGTVARPGVVQQSSRRRLHDQYRQPPARHRARSARPPRCRPLVAARTTPAGAARAPASAPAYAARQQQPADAGERKRHRPARRGWLGIDRKSASQARPCISCASSQ